MREWIERPLNELAEIRVSNVDKKSLPGEKPVLLCNYMDAYGNDYIRSDIAFMSATATVAEIAKFKVDAGDVVITKDSETPDDIGIPAVVMEQVESLVCGYHLALLKTKQELVDPVFLCKQLGSERAARYFAQRAAGSTRYGLSNGALGNVPIVLPPLAKQRVISRILISVDTAIEKTEALIAKYRQIKAGLMHDLFTRGVLPNGQLRPSRSEAPELYRETAIGWIPREWSVDSLQSLCQADITYGIVQAGPHIDGGVPYIRTGDMSGGKLEVERLLRTTSAIALSYKRSEILTDEIVMAIRATVGKVLPVPPELNGANLTQGTARIAPRKDVDAKFLLWALRGEAFQRTLLAEVKGTTFAEVTLTTLRKLPIAHPHSTGEQVKIGERIDRLEGVIWAESDRLFKLHQQKLGLMQDLLTGKVSVSVAEPEAVHA